LIFLLVIADEEKSAICEVYNKYHKRMLYTASQILGKERGEEAVHDVFIKIVDRLEKNPDFLRDKVGQFFVVMVKNHSLNLLNREKMELVPLDESISVIDSITDPELNPEDALLKKESVDKLAALIKQLSVNTRQVLEYRYIEGYSNIEIASILSISQTAVSSRIDRGKAQLRKLLEEGGEQKC